MRLVALGLLFTGCFYDEGMPLPADFGSCPLPADTAAPTDVAEPTWYRDVQPIIVAKCQGCHTDGGLAPFPLDTLNRVSARRGSIHEAVANRTMPPWQPDPCCTPYRWDRSLSDAQRETVSIMERIYKIMPAAEWARAQAAGVYEGSEHDRRDGFIHFSTAAQAAETAAKYFAGQTDLVLLAVDATALVADLKWEPSRGGALFPHLYAPLPISAVVAIHELPLEPEGRHRLPFDAG